MHTLNQTASGSKILSAQRSRHLAKDVARLSSSFKVMLAALDISSLLLANIAASFVTVFLQTMVLHTVSYTQMPDIVSERHSVACLLGLIALAMFWSKSLYTQRVPWWSQVQYIIKVCLLLMLIDGFMSFSLKLYEPRLLIVTTWLFAPAFTVVMRWLGCLLSAKAGWWKIPTVVIGDNSTATDLIYAFHADPCAGYDVHTIFLRDREHSDFDVMALPQPCRNVLVRDGLTEYEQYIKENPHNFYVVSLDAFRGDTRRNLLNALVEAKAPYAIVPSIHQAGLYEMEPRYFFGHDIMMLQARPGRTEGDFSIQKVMKRALDIAVAGTALLVLAPLFGAVALMLRLEGQGGSIYYGGKRIGHSGQPFSCWKFRSMEPNSDHLLQSYLDSDPQAKADWETYRKLPKDPRVTTKTAAFIRKASIDELPQLWNVLTGDMSLVGPRPILENEKHYFSEDALKDYKSVRPGLTGLWQVSGRNATSFKRRVYWDSWYVRNWSLWGDIVILIKTPMVLLFRKGVL
jgi:undecaprenyl-phosphate galactose phosphotransferase